MSVTSDPSGKRYTAENLIQQLLKTGESTNAVMDTPIYTVYTKDVRTSCLLFLQLPVKCFNILTRRESIKFQYLLGPLLDVYKI